ncbi:MAG: c-type cytochrome domain-containing protein [Planctomycetaceae bacterium]
MTSKARRQILLNIVALFFASVTSLSARADEPGAADALQQQLQSLQEKQRSARKQVELKQAAVSVAQERAAELQKELQTAQQRVEGEVAGLAEAEQLAASVAKDVERLTAELADHRRADELLKIAAAAADELNSVRQKQSEVESRRAALQATQFEQQQIEIRSNGELKIAQDQLPAKTKELTAAREALDAAAQALETAHAATLAANRDLDTKIEAVSVERQRLNQAQQTATQIDASVNSLAQSLAIMKEAASLTGKNPQEATAGLAATLDSIKPLQQQAARLVAQAQQQIESAQSVADASRKPVADASAAEQELRQKYAEAGRAHFALQLATADLQGHEKALQQRIESSKAEQAAIAAKQQELDEELKQAAAEVAKYEAVYVARRREAEAAMEPIGRFVSFSKDVAPIFAKRCVACHNTRSAGGRLNMDSFAGLAKGGESGISIAPHDAENSLLWTMISSELMPKDADPLSSDEIATLKKWIDVGAPLDAGIEPTAELFRVMPEVAQPLPPTNYRVPIPVTATAFSPDGSLLASSGYHEVLLWKTDDGSLVRRITNVAERVYDLQFSNDGTQLAVAAGTPGQLGEVKLFSVADGSHLKTLVRTKDAIYAVRFSPDGKRIAAGGADRTISVADAATGATIHQIEDHADWVMDVNWSPDGRQLVTASRDKTSKVFDVESGRSVITFSGHGDAVYSAAFLPDGTSVVSGGSDRQARVWTVADAKEVRKIGGFGSDIFKVFVTPEGHLLTASADRNAREHNLADGASIRDFSGHKDWVYTLAWNAARNLIATGSYDGEIRVWNSQDGSVATSFIAIPKGSGGSTVADVK